jgi:hypothetical protein
MSLTTPDKIRTSEEALSQGESGTELPVLSALRQGLPRGHTAPCLRLGTRQQGCTRRRRHGLRGDRGGRVGELAGRHRDGTTNQDIRAPTGAKGDAPQPRRRRAATGIPTIRDRVVQTAAKLALEPIFEADLEPSAYGYRPGRSGIDAVKEVHRLLCQGFTDVVDPPLGRGAQRSVVASRFVQRMAVLTLTLKTPAAPRRETPPPTLATTRSRRSNE